MMAADDELFVVESGHLRAHIVIGRPENGMRVLAVCGIRLRWRVSYALGSPTWARQLAARNVCERCLTAAKQGA